VGRGTNYACRLVTTLLGKAHTTIVMPKIKGTERSTSGDLKIFQRVIKKKEKKNKKKQASRTKGKMQPYCHHLRAGEERLAKVQLNGQQQRISSGKGFRKKIWPQ